MKLVNRNDTDRCSVARCRQEPEITYQPGATPANPRHPLAFCEKHHTEFNKRQDSYHPLRDEGKGGHDGN